MIRLSQTVDKVNINISLCIFDEILCRGYFCRIYYAIIKKENRSTNLNLVNSAITDYLQVAAKIPFAMLLYSSISIIIQPLSFSERV